MKVTFNPFTSKLQFLSSVDAYGVFADNSLIRGDGGAGNIQDSGILIDDDDVMTFSSNSLIITPLGTDEGINAAIDTGALNILLTAGGIVDAQIIIDNSNTTLSGAGAATNLDSSAWQGADIVTATSKNYLTLKDFKITGNRTGTAGASALYLNACDWTTITGMSIDGSKTTGIELNNCDYPIVAFNRITDVTTYAIYETGGDYGVCAFNITHNNTNAAFLPQGVIMNIYTCNVSKDDGYGYRASGADFQMINSNAVYSPSNTGIYFIGNFSTANGNLVHTSALRAFYMSGPQICSFAGNIAYLPGRDGFEMISCEHSPTIGNAVQQAGNNYDSFKVTTSHHMPFIGNSAISSVGKAEYLFNFVNSDDCIILGCTEEAHGTGSVIFDADSTGNKLAWCQFDTRPINNGTNNIIQWEDTATMTVEGNYNLALELTIKAAGRIKAITTKTGAYTTTATDDVVLGNTAGGNFTITLIAASNTGQTYNIKNTGAGVLTVDGNASETIDAALTVDLVQDETITIISDGNNWWII